MFVYTFHAIDKLKTIECKRLHIDKKRIEQTILIGELVEKDKDVLMKVSFLSSNLSLAVIYKHIGKKVKIVTFFPAKKGRYERKILQ